MTILHYTIGLPPHRNGGSVQYAYTLMQEQSKSQRVIALTCGDTLVRGNVCRIKQTKKNNGIEIFHLTNPLTPTLIYGTKDPDSQHRKITIDFDNIKQFIIKNNVTIMHLHTLMGIHKDIVAYIKGLGVRIVYTTHDFHGLCLHYNFINERGKLCNNVQASQCAICNINEPSDKHLRLASSYIYQFIKSTGIFSLLKKPSVIKTPDDSIKDIPITVEIIAKYDDLIEYYKDFFLLIDKFHYNSSQTEEIFKKFLPSSKGKVIHVVTSGIKDKRKSLNLSDKIKIGFVGSLNEYKGFPALKKVVTELYNDGIENIRILAYSGTQPSIDLDCPLIEYQAAYKYSEISDVMYNLDATIIPSKWYETFSLVALESLAHGRPAIVSDHVGAKDIVARFNPDLIFFDENNLKQILTKIAQNPDLLVTENQKIMSSEWIYSIEQHSKDILAFYNN